jgi:hypothetical protein
MPKNPLVGAAITDKKKLSDLILWEPEPRYSRCAIDLGEGTYEIGDVFTDESPATASSAANLQPTFTDVICLENITIPAGETREVAVFVRGPALLNMDAVTRTSDAESDSSLKTRLADLAAQGIRFVREEVVTSRPSLD